MLRNLVNNKIFKIISVICLIFMMSGLSLFYYNKCNLYILHISILALFLNTFFMFLIFSVLFGITKDTFKSILILSIINTIYLIGNQIKIVYTDEPFVISDLLYLSASSEILNIISDTGINTLKIVIKPSICLILISGVLVFLSYIVKIKITSNKSRILLITSPIIILLFLNLRIEVTRNFILKNIFRIDSRRDYAAMTSNKKYFSEYGLFSGLYAQQLETRIIKPEGYNGKNISKIVSKQNNLNVEKTLGKPNIIVLFSESYFDISVVDEIKFNKQITKNIHKLRDEGISFKMISPSYGGISANVEFEFLTGASLMYFNNGYVPYMQLYTDDSYYNRPSIINELKNNGYKTKIVAYTSDKLFRCGNFYNYLKVDSKEYNVWVSDEHRKGQYVSDEYVVDNIINEFNNKEKDQKLFYMTLTMQSHMPYLKDKYDKYDIKIEESSLPKEMNDTMLSYAQGVYDTDLQLKRLYNYIKTLKEPTIIVFYGDHLPYLKTESGENIIEKLKYFNTDDADLNMFRKYNTESLILANFDIKEKDTKYLGPDLLSAYVLNRMDIKLSDYYKWLYTTKDILPASNLYVSVDKNGKVYNTNKLSGNMKKMYDLRRSVQYKYFIAK